MRLVATSPAPVVTSPEMDTLTELDSRGSILFLGSAFSRPARNIRSAHLPSTNDLKRQFAELMGVAHDAHDLRTLAGAIDSDNQINLYRMLYETFTVSSISESQKKILKLPWLRIYTTNYDDSIELFYRQERSTVSSYSYNDNKPRRIDNGAVIHLHGCTR